MNSPKPTNERGAVLLTTLLLMTVMAAIMIAIVEDIRYSTRRTMNIQAAEQLAWLERGGEDFAQTWLQNTQSKTQLELAQIIRDDDAVVLPLEQGTMSLQIRDARNCFNINQLADSKTKDITRERFSLFLRLLEFDTLEADILSASIQDWVDADSVPNSGGAEGPSYANLKPAYHAANTLMVDISELREVQGMEETVYRRLRPFVCAGSDMKPNRININTLSSEQAPLLALLFGGLDGYSTAQSVIIQRPLSGYESVDALWNLQSVQDLELKGAGKSLADTRTDRVEVDIFVKLNDQSRARKIVYTFAGAAGVELVSRRLVD